MMNERRNLLSGYAKRLLARAPRTSAVEPPPPPDEPMNNFFLVEFANKCSNEFIQQSHGDDSENEEDEINNQETTTTLIESTDSSSSNVKEHRKCTITLRNIPFRATQKTVTEFCDGFNVTDIQLPTLETDSSRSAGYALVTFTSPDEAAEAAATLDGEQFDGRDIRTQQHLISIRQHQKLQDSSRYYIPSSEALQLGATHGMKGAKGIMKRFPCFLCAREGHQASLCPYQVCFRCQKSGHMARDCPPKKWGRVEFCSKCGAANDHNTSECKVIVADHVTATKSHKVPVLQSILGNAECLLCRTVHCSNDFSHGVLEATKTESSGLLYCDSSWCKRQNQALETQSDKPDLYCIVCGGKGHIGAICKFYSSPGTAYNGGKGNNGKGRASYTQLDDDDGGHEGGSRKRSRQTGSFSDVLFHGDSGDDDDDRHFTRHAISSSSFQRSGKGKGGGQGSECYNCGGFGHIAALCPTPGTRDKCYNCGQYGHRAAACTTPRVGKGKGKGKGINGSYSNGKGKGKGSGFTGGKGKGKGGGKGAPSFRNR